MIDYCEFKAKEGCTGTEPDPMTHELCEPTATEKSPPGLTPYKVVETCSETNTDLINYCEFKKKKTPPGFACAPGQIEISCSGIQDIQTDSNGRLLCPVSGQPHGCFADCPAGTRLVKSQCDTFMGGSTDACPSLANCSDGTSACCCACSVGGPTGHGCCEPIPPVSCPAGTEVQCSDTHPDPPINGQGYFYECGPVSCPSDETIATWKCAGTKTVSDVSNYNDLGQGYCSGYDPSPGSTLLGCGTCEARYDCSAHDDSGNGVGPCVKKAAGPYQRSDCNNACTTPPSQPPWCEIVCTRNEDGTYAPPETAIVHLLNGRTLTGSMYWMGGRFVNAYEARVKDLTGKDCPIDAWYRCTANSPCATERMDGGAVGCGYDRGPQ